MKSLILPVLLTAAALFGQHPADSQMDNYVVGFFKRGPKWTAEVTPATEAIQEGHMANLRKMASTGKLLVAGPFTDDGNLRGMLIFKLESIAEAERMVADDPAVKAGRLVLEFHPWFAAKGISVKQ